MQSRNRHADLENGHMDMGWGRGTVMNWEIGIDIYILPCVRQTASGNLIYSTGSSAPCFVVTRRVRWGRGRPKRERIYVYI